MATERIEIRVTPAELADIKALATANSSSVADMVRLAIVNYAAAGGDELPDVVMGGVLQAFQIVQRPSIGFVR